MREEIIRHSAIGGRIEMSMEKIWEQDSLDSFRNESYYWADKIIRGKQYTLRTGNPLYIYVFLDLPDKVWEGVEKGFSQESEESIEMEKTKVQEYAKHPWIKYHPGDWEKKGIHSEGESVEEKQDLRNWAELFLKIPKKEGEFDTYSYSCPHTDIMWTALFGESKNIFLEGLERRALLDCGLWLTRNIVCRCRNEEMLSALMQKECTSFYIEIEDALEYKNPIFLRLIYENEDKYLKKDIYDRSLKSFVEEYYLIKHSDIKLLDRDFTEDGNLMEETVLKKTKPISDSEWRTLEEYIEDFASCMKYLKKQGYIRKKEKLSEINQAELEHVLEDIESNVRHELYEDIVEIVHHVEP